MRTALILTDGKAGHENQSRAFARALGLEAEVVPVAFKSRLHKALSYLLDWLGIRTLRLFKGRFSRVEREETGRESSSSSRSTRLSSSQLQTANCKLQTPIVIGTGSGTFYAAKALAKRLGTKCGVVLYPRGYRLGSFDCILAPAFDNPPARPNVVTIPVNLVANDEAFYAAGVAAFQEKFAVCSLQFAADGTFSRVEREETDRESSSSSRSTRLPSSQLQTANCKLQTANAVAVVVGGPNKCATLTADWMRRELVRIFAETPGCPHWVTTSRRTPPDVEAVVASFPFDYALLYSRDHFNPIPAFVKLAARLYVTAESTGMLSEACSFGAARVYALDNLKPGPHKFRRFVDGLAAAGYLGDAARKADLSGAFAAACRLLGV